MRRLGIKLNIIKYQMHNDRGSIKLVILETNRAIKSRHIDIYT